VSADNQEEAQRIDGWQGSPPAYIPHPRRLYNPPHFRPVLSSFLDDVASRLCFSSLSRLASSEALDDEEDEEEEDGMLEWLE
jgi:hypothetical protein